MNERESELSIRLMEMVREELENRQPSYSFAASVTPEELHVITIPAASPQVGPLEFGFFDDEVTVAIGELYHQHFAPQLHDEWPSEKALRETVVDAIDFAEGFMAGQYVLSRTYRGEDEISAGIRHIDNEEPFKSILSVDEFLHPADSSESETCTEEFLWSGPYQPDRTP